MLATANPHLPLCASTCRSPFSRPTRPVTALPQSLRLAALPKGEDWNRTEEDQAWSHLQRVP
jgi:hypothetical protein